jgi:hypothetical protein
MVLPVLRNREVGGERAMTAIGEPQKWRRYEPIEEPTRQEPSREVEPQETPTTAPEQEPQKVPA